MPRKNDHSVKLLVPLVLFLVAAATVCHAPNAGARGFFNPAPVWSPWNGGDITGDPDVGQGIVSPPPNTKYARPKPGNGDTESQSAGGWARWTSRIWAMLGWRITR